MARRQQQTNNSLYPVKRLEDFSGGLNDEHPSTIPDECLSLAKNVEYTIEGKVKPRPGMSKRFASDFDTNPVLGMSPYYKSDGTTRLVMAAGTNLYADKPHVVFNYASQADWQKDGVYTNLNTAPTAGTSVSDVNPSTDLHSGTATTFKIAVDGDSTAHSVTLTVTSLTTGAAIASAIQTGIQALAGSYTAVTAVYQNGVYVITSGTTGTSSKVVITAGASNDVTAALKIGLANGGNEVTGTTNSLTMITPPTNVSFIRASTAYKQDGTQVAANVPRYEAGKFGQGIMIEGSTTNKIASEGSAAQDWSLWSHWNTVYWKSNSQFDDPAMGKVFQGVAATTSPYFFDYYSYTFEANGKYTISLWLKADRNITASTMGYVINNSSSSTVGSIVKSIDIATNWQRFEWTVTPVEACASNGGFGVNLTVPESGVTFYAARPQFEPVPFATTFTNGTRTSEVLTVPTANVFHKGGWTIEMTVISKIEVGITNQYFWSLRIDDDHRYGLGINSNTSKLYAWVINGAKQSTISALGPVIERGVPYQIAFSGDGSNLRLFCNGEQIGDALPYTEPEGALSSVMYLGMYYSETAWLYGIIDDFRVSSRARTLAEHQAYYASGLPHAWDVDTTYLLPLDGDLNYPAGRQGVWQSPVQNATSSTDFATLSAIWSDNIPVNTSVFAQIRTSADGVNWSMWYSQINGGISSAPANGYSQIRFVMQELQNTVTPALSAATVVYDGEPNAQTLLTGLSVASLYSFCQLADTLVICNGIDTPKKYDGETISDITAAPKAQLCVTYKNRVWMARTSENRSRLYFSDPVDVDTWQAVNFMDVNPADGDEIIALIPLPTTLLIIKQHNVYFLQGTTPLNFSFTNAGMGGTISPYGAIYTPYGAFTVDREGLWATDFRTESRISLPIQKKTWNGLNQHYLNKAALFYYEDRLFVAVPSGDSNVNNMVLVCDLTHKTKPWSVWTGWNPSCFVAYWESGKWDYLFGSSKSGNVYAISGADNDAGNPFTATVETRHIPLIADESSSRIKWIDISAGGGKTDTEIDLSFVSDGNANSSKAFIVPAGAENASFRLYPSTALCKTIGINAQFKDTGYSGATLLSIAIAYFAKAARPTRVI